MKLRTGGKLARTPSKVAATMNMPNRLESSHTISIGMNYFCSAMRAHSTFSNDRNLDRNVDPEILLKHLFWCTRDQHVVVTNMYFDKNIRHPNEILCLETDPFGCMRKDCHGHAVGRVEHLKTFDTQQHLVRTSAKPLHAIMMRVTKYASRILSGRKVQTVLAYCTSTARNVDLHKPCVFLRYLRNPSTQPDGKSIRYQCRI